MHTVYNGAKQTFLTETVKNITNAEMLPKDIDERVRKQGGANVKEILELSHDDLVRCLRPKTKLTVDLTAYWYKDPYRSMMCSAALLGVVPIIPKSSLEVRCFDDDQSKVSLIKYATSLVEALGFVGDADAYPTASPFWSEQASALFF